MHIWNLEQKCIHFLILQSADGHINLFKYIEKSVGDVFQNFLNFGVCKNAVLTVDKHRDFVPFWQFFEYSRVLAYEKAFALDTLFGDFPLSKSIFLFREIFAILKLFFYF